MQPKGLKTTSRGSKKAIVKKGGKDEAKRHKKRKETYNIYIYKVLKQVHSDTRRLYRLHQGLEHHELVC